MRLSSPLDARSERGPRSRGRVSPYVSGHGCVFLDTYLRRPCLDRCSLVPQGSEYVSGLPSELIFLASRYWGSPCSHKAKDEQSLTFHVSER